MFNMNHLILEIMNSLYYLSMTMIGYSKKTIKKVFQEADKNMYKQKN